MGATVKRKRMHFSPYKNKEVPKGILATGL